MRRIRIGEKEVGIKPLIVGVISSLDVSEATDAKDDGADILELRVDLMDLEDKKEIKSRAREMKAKTGLPVIITNRKRDEGGRFRGGEDERISLLEMLIDVGDAFDIELSTEEHLRRTFIEKARSFGKTVILSYHDFRGMPTKEKMIDIVEKMQAEGDIAKVAVTPGKPGEVLILLETSLEIAKHDKPFVMIGMGDIGRHFRLISHIYGSALTYGFVRKGVAPGQLNIRDIKMAWSIMERWAEGQR